MPELMTPADMANAPQVHTPQQAEHESFAAQWAAAEKAAAAAADAGEVEDAPDPVEAEAPEAPAEPEPTNAKPKAEAAEGEGDDAAEADKNPGRVTVAERAKWREEKRQARAKIDEERRSAMAELDSEREKLEAKYGGFRKAGELLEVGDFDGAAEAMGYKDWNSLQSEALAASQSPAIKRLRELERRNREREEAEARSTKEREQREAQRQREQAQAEWKSGLASDLEDSEDPAVAALAGDDRFVAAVFAIQQQEWDGRETLSSEEAAARALQGVANTYLTWRKVFEEHGQASPAVSRIIGDLAAAKPETTPPEGSTSAKHGRRRAPKTVSQRSAAEAASPGELSEQQWKAKFTKMIAQSTPHHTDA